jgi:hypothetical protein
MFGFFKKKSEADKLRDKYKAMIKEAYELSHTNRKASDLKNKEAEDLWKEIERLEAEAK